MTAVQNDFTIRPATIEDSESIGAMNGEFRSYLVSIGDLEACSGFGAEQYRRDGFGERAAFRGLVAERAGEPLGYALYAPDYNTDTGSRTIYLHDLFVRAVYRGQGVGEALLERVAAIGKEIGANAVNWHVLHTNASAIRFYEHVGARAVDTVRLMTLDVR